ncbi:NADPH quinone reductase or Zn-dependent oxidoreductase [Corynebacterium glutamicum Z188]|uniref:enoyl-[acyl-carrier-protein] reductase n=1 Tax=Corynebacterium glutamicum TaxID=1718 RepID=A0AB36IC00_CORGT|nr:zinc-binding dehydrogenase [Corynebacterium glutamicum]AGN20591.1 NADPH quinone reductase or Zn-dependent oxidoreductase [Corynebacterium glutamicum SCgG1]AGN23616.1 NADPH quinone reductase or Zn-dependent oxidoreductase [Corynebacterium glutamicum SCgG2]EGV41178.1 NADPH quinone reductase or Zn-dependent oxidoreductase [Corynebacterium glutamicum S9114]EPP39307.1 NADPH quinone reductase or Zn-dependent oxidoreductase [Corynebacterium glutamicum Z188]NII88983.1 NADPH:quinone reductase-like Z
MRAITHSTFGNPADVLQVTEKDIPNPGPGQARIRVTLATIHNHDLWIVKGSYGFVPDLPAAAGTEAVGIVDALGEGVEGLQVGQRVASGTSFGIWAEYALVDASGLIPVPEQLSDESAAQLVAMPFSAISLLDFLDMKPGEWLIQNSANGAVGRLLAQLAESRGIHVVGLVRRDAGVQELAAQNISGVVSTETPGWEKQVEEITGGASIAVALDSVGGSSAADLVKLLGEGGTLVSFGAMGNPVMEIPSGPVIFKHITVKGFWGSKVSREMPAEKKTQLFGELIARILDGTLTLPVDSTFDAADIVSAVRASSEPGRAGKVLIRF